MMFPWLIAAHIAVLGYWLGSELVINSSYRYVCYNSAMPFDERTRLMDHVMHVDQHVRYALALQATLGTALAALMGYIPGGETVATAAGVAGVAWLMFIEAVHRLRHGPVGRLLGSADRGFRYVLMTVLIAVALKLIGGGWPMPDWLRWKLALFAGVMACGVGIRFALISHFTVWAIMARDGPTDSTNAIIRRTYMRATSVLALLWLFILAITILSVGKPG